MTDRLRAVVLAAEKLSDLEQDELASQMEALFPVLQPANKLAAIDFSVFADLPGDAVDVLDRLRHEAPPTPPYEEPS